MQPAPASVPIAIPAVATSQKWKLLGTFSPPPACRAHRSAPRCTPSRPSGGRQTPRTARSGPRAGGRCGGDGGGGAATRCAALLKFRFRSLAFISRPRALWHACVLRDELFYFRATRSISLAIAAWRLDDKALPANMMRRRIVAAVYRAIVCGRGSRYASKKRYAWYATMTRALPAGTCTENASSNGKPAYWLILNHAVEHALGPSDSATRTYGQKRAMI